VIRAFDRGAHQRERFDRANLDLTNTAITVNRLIAFLMPALIVMLNLTSIAIIWFGSHRIDQGVMQVGAMIASLQYAMQILFAVFMVTAMFVMLPRASASAARINEVLEVAPEIVDPAAPLPPRPAATRGHVEFENVTFQYPGAEEPALTGVSFTAHPGEVTAIVGGTGSGKSTLAGLIPRFYDVNQGRVLLDGVDVREMTQADLRARIGFVLRRRCCSRERWPPTSATAASRRRTRRCATRRRWRRPSSSSTRCRDVRVARSRRAASTSRADRNSGSPSRARSCAAGRLRVRRQLLGARLHHRRQAARALKSETANATVFVVAQRISTVINADRIVVPRQRAGGRGGTHAELLKTSGIYREIVSSQVSLEEVAMSTPPRPRPKPPRAPPRRAAADNVGPARSGGLGMPTQKAKNFKGTLVGCWLPAPASRGLRSSIFGGDRHRVQVLGRRFSAGDDEDLQGSSRRPRACPGPQSTSTTSAHPARLVVAYSRQQLSVLMQYLMRRRAETVTRCAARSRPSSIGCR
jgi:ATP-binding cassette subfamily B protein